MRKINIGDRKIADITKEEFIDYIYNVVGNCASNKYWGEPIFSEWWFYADGESLHFKFHQVRMDDGLVGGITSGFLGDDFHFFIDISMGREKNMSHKPNYKEICWILDKGFNLPIFGVGHKRSDKIDELLNNDV